MMNMDVDKCLVLVFRCYGFEIKFFEKEIIDCGLQLQLQPTLTVKTAI